MYKSEKLTAVFWIIVFALFAVLTGGVNEKCRAYPYFVCGLGIAVSLFQFLNVTVKEKKGTPIEEPIKPLKSSQIRDILITLVFSFVYAALMQILGYFVTTFLFVILFSYWQYRGQKKYVYVLVALGMMIVVYATFKVMLRVPLPSGILF